MGRCVRLLGVQGRNVLPCELLLLRLYQTKLKLAERRDDVIRKNSIIIGLKLSGADIRIGHHFVDGRASLQAIDNMHQLSGPLETLEDFDTSMAQSRSANSDQFSIAMVGTHAGCKKASFLENFLARG